MKKMLAVVVLAVLSCSSVRAADCANGQCQSSRSKIVRTVASAPTKIVERTAKAVRERKCLFSRTRAKSGCR